MLYGEGLAGVAELCLLVYCLLDVARTPHQHVRTLPKPVWLILCFVPPVVGPLCWLLFGRPQYASAAATRAAAGDPGRFPEYDRPGRAVAPNPDDDEAFLRGLRERAEQQRRTAREAAELERRRAEGDQTS